LPYAILLQKILVYVCACTKKFLYRSGVKIQTDDAGTIISGAVNKFFQVFNSKGRYDKNGVMLDFEAIY
jgi:hypothetical protein